MTNVLLFVCRKPYRDRTAEGRSNEPAVANWSVFRKCVTVRPRGHTALTLSKTLVRGHRKEQIALALRFLLAIGNGIANIGRLTE